MRLETLDLNLIRVFDALMNTRSVTEAAKRLHISQPSTSNALARLREVSNDQLLERIGNDMVPTQYARDLWPYVRDALSTLENGLASVSEFHPSQFDGLFRIGMDSYCVSFFAPRLIEHLRKQAPSLSIEILPAPPHGREADMIRDECDLIIGPTWHDTPHLERETLFTETFTLLVRRQHRFSRQPDTLTVQSFAAADHVLYSERGCVTGIIDRALEQHNLSRRVVVTLPFYPAIGTLLAQTDYVASFGRSLASSLCDGNDLVVLPLPIDSVDFEVSMLWTPRNTHAASHRWLRSVCTELAQAIRTESA